MDHPSGIGIGGYDLTTTRYFSREAMIRNCGLVAS